MEAALAAAVGLTGSTSQGAAQTAALQGSSNTDVAALIGTIMKQQFGDNYNLEKIAVILQKNMDHFAKQGKLTPAQIQQLQMFADKHDKSKQQQQQQQPPLAAAVPVASTSQQQQPVQAAASTSQQQIAQPTAAAQHQTVQQIAQAAIQQASSYMKPGHAGDNQSKLISQVNPGEHYPPINQTINYTNPGPVSWTATRPTLTGGLAAGRISSTPAQIARGSEDASLSIDDNRTRRKNSSNDQNMRRTIQDLVSSVDPNVKIEPEVEDLLLNIADEFIDSVTNFACRLAKHRGGDTLDVRDLQLHLERNHNIRIPGFASDETQISLSQSGIGPAVPAAATKKNAQGQHTTLRAQRLAQVQQAKREAKLM
ncbi:hypothetical protein FA15DRAFT_638456 [Coprinopsis marcescibilis]|uniref:TBP-associated factor 12 n=1 Tax=Coprinopsis marcescibilis TaxID=230819 RepID=A0A5C3L1I3_COPMA|nr:hypothetical protein FA15DRAFT_638456 [Coprinopsis marcescibilis]